MNQSYLDNQRHQTVKMSKFNNVKDEDSLFMDDIISNSPSKKVRIPEKAYRVLVGRKAFLHQPGTSFLKVDKNSPTRPQRVLKKQKMDEKSKNSIAVLGVFHKIICALSPNNNKDSVNDHAFPSTSSRNIVLNKKNAQTNEKLNTPLKELKVTKGTILQSQKDTLDFDEIMSSGTYRRFFKEYCKTEISCENIEFWEQVQYRYKKLKNRNQRITLAEYLFANYIDPNSICALNIPQRVATQIKQRIDMAKIDVDCTDKLSDLFDKLQMETEQICQDAYARFRKSKLYKQLLEIKKERETKLETQLQYVRQDSCKF